MYIHAVNRLLVDASRCIQLFWLVRFSSSLASSPSTHSTGCIASPSTCSTGSLPHAALGSLHTQHWVHCQPLHMQH